MIFYSPTSKLWVVNLPFILHIFNTPVLWSKYGNRLPGDGMHRWFCPQDHAIGMISSPHFSLFFPLVGSRLSAAMQSGHTRRLAWSVWVVFFFSSSSWQRALMLKIILLSFACRYTSQNTLETEAHPALLPSVPGVSWYRLVGVDASNLPLQKPFPNPPVCFSLLGQDWCFPSPQTMQPAESTSRTHSCCCPWSQTSSRGRRRGGETPH